MLVGRLSSYFLLYGLNGGLPITEAQLKRLAILIGAWKALYYIAKEIACVSGAWVRGICWVGRPARVMVHVL